MRREYLFDNLKSLLILLVVFGHFSETYIDSNVYLRLVYILIYMFHMPLFVFISGYFSKNADKCRGKAIQDLLIPFLFLDFLYYLVDYFIYKDMNINIFNPGWTLWYLLSLFFWRFFLKDIIRLKNKTLIIGISVVIGLLVGTVDKNTTFLSFSRAFGFLPFFLIGYYTNNDFIEKIKRIPKVLSLLGVALVFSSTYLIMKFFSLKYTILYLSPSYQSFRLNIEQGIMIRVLFYIFSMLMCVFIINLMSISKYKISQIGRKTMIIYAGHIYFILLLRKLIPVFKSNLVNSGITLLSAITIVLILSAPIFEKAYNTFFSMIGKTLKIDKAKQSSIVIED